MVRKTDTSPKMRMQPDAASRPQDRGFLACRYLVYCLCHLPMAARLNVDRSAPRSVVRVLLLFIACTPVAIFYAVARAAEAPPDWWVRLLPLGEWFGDLTRAGRPLAHKRAVYRLVLANRWLKLTYT
jgi:hypothetical protein